MRAAPALPRPARPPKSWPGSGSEGGADRRRRAGRPGCGADVRRARDRVAQRSDRHGPGRADRERGNRARAAPTLARLLAALGPVRRMRLDVAALAPGVVLQLAPGGVESIAHGDERVFVALAVDRDFRARALDVDPHHELLALLLVAGRGLDHHAAAHDVPMELPEFRGLLANRGLEGRRMRHAAK